LIEDSAASLGSRYDGVPCGAFGEISVFSFYRNKIITGYSGGVLSCQNDIFIERITNLISQGKSCHENGHNYRMSNVTAAIVSSQFQELEERVL
jgi:dTDP-4-amino-4,6-dideoxygalactose transaminase